MELPALIDTIAARLSTAPNVRALFLSGSFGYGLADEFSDIDFLLVTPDGPTDEIAALCREAISGHGEIILWWDRSTKPMLINAITEDWQRIDIEIATPAQIAHRTRDTLKVLFDHDDLYSTLAPLQAPPSGPNPSFFRWQIEEFIRILGMLPLALGRQEYVIGVFGVFMLRSALINLLIEETAAPNRGGMLHLNRQITHEQQALLLSMPVIEPTAEALQTAQIAYAAAFLPRARLMAAKLGIEWPERFETATWANLHRKLGIEKPY